jgi:hypothetical protein
VIVALRAKTATDRLDAVGLLTDLESSILFVAPLPYLLCDRLNCNNRRIGYCSLIDIDRSS